MSTCGLHVGCEHACSHNRKGRQGTSLLPNRFRRFQVALTWFWLMSNPAAVRAPTSRQLQAQILTRNTSQPPNHLGGRPSAKTPAEAEASGACSPYVRPHLANSPYVTTACYTNVQVKLHLNKGHHGKQNRANGSVVRQLNIHNV